MLIYNIYVNINQLVIMLMKLNELGQIILANRRAHGLTQKTLADRAGVSRYTVIKLENGQADDIQFKILSAILAELRLTLTVTGIPVSGITVLGDTME